MKKEAKYEARCADCGGTISPGEQMNYSPPAGQFPAEYRHIKCPEPKRVAPRGVNHGQREDPELAVFRMRDCDQCGDEYAVKRTSLAARRAAFVCHHCAEGNAVQRERHLKAVA
jgi:hypothetical protein